MTDKTTIEVAGDSLTAAIAGTERGERWESGDGCRLVLQDGKVWGVNMAMLPLSGWKRVDEPLTCPRCGVKVEVCQYSGKWTCLCPHCGLRDGSTNAYPYLTEAEARAAWFKIGTRSLPWRRMEKRPGKPGWLCLWLLSTGYVHTSVADYDGAIAWLPLSDLPLPSWAKEGKP